MQFSWWKSTMPLAYWMMAPGAGQGLEAARVGAVHAAVLADQPFQPAVLPPRRSASRSRTWRQVHRVVVNADAGADLVAQVVPLHARGLAGLAADAGRDVDQLGDFRGLRAPPEGGRYRGGGAERRRYLAIARVP